MNAFGPYGENTVNVLNFLIVKSSGGSASTLKDVMVVLPAGFGKSIICQSFKLASKFFNVSVLVPEPKSHLCLTQLSY